MPKSWPMCTDMSMLLELQMRLRRAVLGGDTAEIVAAIQGDGLDPAARVGIYRHHAFATLGDALQSTFPVVCRLVDKRFFAYAAHEYLREHPPHSRCLVEYGADFADFLAGFAPCQQLPYLADVARFEWALNIAATVREAAPLQAEALAAVPAQERPHTSRSACSPRSATSPRPGRSTRSGRPTKRTRCRQSISRAAAPAWRFAAPARQSSGGGSTRGPSHSERRSPTASCSLPQWRQRP